METEKEQTHPSAELTEQSEAQASGEEDEKAMLAAQLREKEAEAKANYEMFLRERADLENFKRRMQREQAESIRFANEPLIRDLLPVLDNLERAVSHAQGGGNGQPLVEGVNLVVRSFLETLEKYGVTRVSAKGEPFDPSKHEAMAQVESVDIAPNVVVDEYRPAYLLHGRLLRPALVTVAKAPSEEKKTAE
ncbi:MAG TPA: nucleotide exchange factor GrpE [Methylomirabilota bacterium]|jgi:molecular chaperone GrpE|nr:nucleotide exchange factor GrpE [Methylomirabilota bacterium]